MRRTAGLIAAVGLLVAGPIGAAGADTRVTRDNELGSYLRYDGESDATMESCSTGLRTQNEPSMAVDPADHEVMVAGSND